MDKYEKAALKLVNKIRLLQGNEELESLPLGEIGEPESCPIANGIKGYADEERIGFKLNSLELSLDPSALIRDFIERFDENEYPHLLGGYSKKEYEADLAEEQELE
ncbi:MAG TPA: hypothetical protein VNX68_04920 [Nitrosopumilaceae archaeon]|jgi:hypothetical protein|nr:hypothetical protein [Nitrosopumilaceae archaeon]